MLSVMVIDDSVLMRSALVGLIQSHGKFQVVEEGSYDVNLLQRLRSVSPQVVVLNLDDSVSLGLRIVGRVHNSLPHIPIMGVSKRNDNPAFGRLLELGLKGLVSAQCQPLEFYAALIKVAKHEHAMSRDIAEYLALSVLPNPVASPFESLTTREIEVACALMEGQRMPAIAKQLSVSPKTVATYKYRIYEKLQIDTEVALLKLGLQFGLVDLQRTEDQPSLF